MTFLFISLALFIAALIGFVVMLGLWVYTDAKIRTDKPVIWTLIVLLVPNLLGLVIYLLVGRTKDIKSEGRYKRPLMALALCFFFTWLLMIGNVVKLVMDESCDAAWSVSNGVYLIKQEKFIDNEWSISVKSAKGRLSKTVHLSAEDLAAFHVTAYSEGESLSLQITQDETVKRYDIANMENEKISLDEFQAGKLKLTVIFDNVKNAKLWLSWNH